MYSVETFARYPKYLYGKILKASSLLVRNKLPFTKQKSLIPSFKIYNQKFRL